MCKEKTYLSVKEYEPVLIVSVLILFLILTVAVVSAFWPKYEERFFELGLLGKDKKAEGYFTNNNTILETGSSVFWHIYIHNHMGSTQKVSIKVKLLNSTMQAPNDQEHESSPILCFIEFPVTLSVNETKLILFSWSILEADFHGSFIIVKRLIVNNQTIEVDPPTLSDDNRFRVVFELWVYDESIEQYRFEWDSGKGFYSVSLYIWFKLATPTM